MGLQLSTLTGGDSERVQPPLLHGFLRRVTGEPDKHTNDGQPRAVVFAGQLSTKVLRHLKGHKFGKSVLCPGAFYIQVLSTALEMALNSYGSRQSPSPSGATAATGAGANSTIELSGIEFITALWLASEKDEFDVRVEVTRQVVRGFAVFCSKFTSRPRQRQASTHNSAPSASPSADFVVNAVMSASRVDTTVPTPGAPDFQAVRKLVDNPGRDRGLTPVTKPQFYAKMAQLGFDYGPHFQRVEETWQGPPVAVAKIRFTSGAGASAGGGGVMGQLDACFLDSCLQMTTGASEQTTSIPSKIGRLVVNKRVLQSLADNELVWAYAWCPPSTDITQESTQFWVYANNGELVLTALGFVSTIMTRARTGIDGNKTKKTTARSASASSASVGLSATGLHGPRGSMQKPAADELSRSIDHHAFCVSHTPIDVHSIVGGGGSTSRKVVIVPGPGELSALLATGVSRVVQAGHELVWVQEIAQLTDVVASVGVGAGVILAVDLGVANSTNTGDVEKVNMACGFLLEAFKRLIRVKKKQSPRIWLVFAGKQQLVGPALLAMVRVARLELRLSICTLLDASYCLTQQVSQTSLSRTAGDSAAVVKRLLCNSLAAAYAHADFTIHGCGERDNVLLTVAQYQRTDLLRAALASNASIPVVPQSTTDVILIVGGCRGLGLALGHWMAVEKGVRHLVLASRSGVISTYPEDQKLVADMKARGTRVDVVACDVTDDVDVARLINSIVDSPAKKRLAGVVHSAMVLDDGLIGGQNMERCTRVLQPKVAGAWNLHRATVKLQLDFFVLFSSTTSFFGNQGQFAYGAANGYLDGLCVYRRQCGLPATTVNWGAFEGVGYLARTSDVMTKLRASGIGGIKRREFFRCFDAIVGTPSVHNNIAILRVDWPKWFKAHPALEGQFQFQPLRLPFAFATDHHDGKPPHVETTTSTHTRSNDQPLVASTASTGSSGLFKEVVAEILETLPDQLDMDSTYIEHGGDSALSVEVQGAILETFGVEVPIADWHSHTLGEISAMVLGKATVVHETPESDAGRSLEYPNSAAQQHWGRTQEQRDPQQQQVQVHPGTRTEVDPATLFQNVVAEILETLPDQLDMDSTYIEHGGDSALSVEVQGAILETFGVEVPIADWHSHTLGEISAMVLGKATVVHETPESDAGRSLEYPHRAGQLHGGRTQGLLGTRTEVDPATLFQDVVAEILETLPDQLDMDSTYIEHGGDSALSVEVQGAILETFGVEVPIADWHSHTLGEISAMVLGETASTAPTPQTGRFGINSTADGGVGDHTTLRPGPAAAAVDALSSATIAQPARVAATTSHQRQVEISFRKRVLSVVRSLAAVTLEADESLFDGDTMFRDLGGDSITAMEYQGKLATEFDTEVPFGWVWDSTLDELADALVASEMSLQIAAVGTASRTMTEPPATNVKATPIDNGPRGLTRRAPGLRMQLGHGQQLDNRSTSPTARAAPTTRAPDVVSTEPKKESQSVDARKSGFDTPADSNDVFPLSDMQAAYWIGRQADADLSLGGVACHFFMEFDGHDLDVDALTDSWNMLIQHHEMLRAVITTTGNSILANVPRYDIEYVDLTALSLEEQQLELDDLRVEYSNNVFEADNWPLFEITVRKHNAQYGSAQAAGTRGSSFRTFLDFDHLIVDMKSVLLLVREWGVAYRARLQHVPLQMQTPPVAFHEVCAAIEQQKKTPKYDAAKQHWHQRIQDGSIYPSPPLLDMVKGLPIDDEPVVFGREQYDLGLPDWGKCKDVAAAAGVTPAMLVMTAFAKSLALHSGGVEQFTINMPMFSQVAVQRQFASVVGDLTTTLLLSIDLSATSSEDQDMQAEEPEGSNGAPPQLPSVLKLARRISRRWVADMGHAMYSGVQVARDLAKMSTEDGAGMFPVVFTHVPNNNADGGSEWLGESHFSMSATPQVLLDCTLIGLDSGAISLAMDFHTPSLPRTVVQSILMSTVMVLQSIADAGRSCLYQPLMVPLSQHQAAQYEAVNEVAETEHFPSHDLYSAFQAAAQSHPSRVAGAQGSDNISYAQLESASARIGMELLSRIAPHSTSTDAATATAKIAPVGNSAENSGSTRSDPLVVVVMDPSLPRLTAIFGILWAAAGYVPLNPSDPDERLIGIIRATGSRAILVDDSQFSRLKDIACQAGCPQTAVVSVNQVLGLPAMTMSAWTPNPSAQRAMDRPRRSRLDSLCYVMYTSGSTGQPKGVMLEQQCVLNTVGHFMSSANVTCEDVFLGLHAYTFDLSVWDMFGCLLGGSCLVLPDVGKHKDMSHVTDLIHSHRVTMWNTVPVWMEMLVTYASVQDADPAMFESLRAVILCGDVIPASLPDRIRNTLGIKRQQCQRDSNGRMCGIEVLCLGGPTEDTIYCVEFPTPELVDEGWGNIPYGFPIGRMKVAITHHEGRQLVPVGIWGEICFTGVGVCRGYLGDPVKTNERFLPHPLTGERMHRTGDWGRITASGFVQIAGRIDNQVKMNGFRIELGEVEATISNHELVEHTGVIVLGSDTGPQQLVACVCPLPSAVVVDETVGGASSGARSTLFSQSVGSPQSLAEFLDEHPNPRISPVVLEAYKAALFGVRRDLPDAESGVIQLPEPSKRNGEAYARASLRNFDQSQAVSRAIFNSAAKCIGAYIKNGDAARTFALVMRDGAVEGMARQLTCSDGTVFPVAQEASIFTDKLHAPHNKWTQSGAFQLFVCAPKNHAYNAEFLLRVGNSIQNLTTTAAALGLAVCPVAGARLQCLAPSVTDEVVIALVCGLPTANPNSMVLPQFPYQATTPTSDSGHPKGGNANGDSGGPAKANELSHSVLRAHCEFFLPAYMVPTRFEFFEERLPQSNNGKLDRKALQKLMREKIQRKQERRQQQSHQASRTTSVPSSVAAMTRIWSKVLSKSEHLIGLDDDFFGTHGGDSLLSVLLMSSINKEFGLSLPSTAIFTHRTLREMLQVVSGRIGGSRGESVTRALHHTHSKLLAEPRSPDRKDDVVVCIHPAGGDILCYQQIARLLASSSAGCHVFAIEDLCGESGAGSSIAEVVRLYAQVIKATTASFSRVHLLGFSFGGVLAHELLACSSSITGSSIPETDAGPVVSATILDTKVVTEASKPTVRHTLGHFLRFIDEKLPSSNKLPRVNFEDPEARGLEANVESICKKVWAQIGDHVASVTSLSVDDMTHFATQYMRHAELASDYNTTIHRFDLGHSHVQAPLYVHGEDTPNEDVQVWRRLYPDGTIVKVRGATHSSLLRDEAHVRMVANLMESAFFKSKPPSSIIRIAQEPAKPAAHTARTRANGARRRHLSERGHARTQHLGGGGSNDSASASASIREVVRSLVRKVLPAGGEVSDDTVLADVGVDSLGHMQLFESLAARFGRDVIKLPQVMKSSIALIVAVLESKWSVDKGADSTVPVAGQIRREGERPRTKRSNANPQNVQAGRSSASSSTVEAVREIVSKMLPNGGGDLTDSTILSEVGMDSLGYYRLYELLCAQFGRESIKPPQVVNSSVASIVAALRPISAVAPPSFANASVAENERDLQPSPSTSTHDTEAWMKHTASSFGEPIAIVGTACIFPGAPNVTEFWRRLKAGKGMYLDAETLDEFASKVISFDPNFFGLSEADAKIVDPQQRMFLEIAFQAVQDAALDVDNTRVAVMSSVSLNSYLTQNLVDSDVTRAAGTSSAAFMRMLLSSDKDYTSTRFSHMMGFTGPSMTVQSACSSSLAAVLLACDALHHDRCDASVVGAASIAFPMDRYNATGTGDVGLHNMMADGGHCKPFDKNTTGTVPGTGGACFVLKRLRDAVEHGDNIVSCIVGGAINNDGNRKGQYTQVSEEAQIEMLKAAYSSTGLPDVVTHIGMVEGHGTGTRLGDPIEVSALSTFLQQARLSSMHEQAVSPVMLGSVKGNMGHLDAAAGAAGLLKASLCLNHSKCVPHVNFTSAGEAVQSMLSSAKLEVCTRLRPLAKGQTLAGVSSFGMGGTNVHLVLQSAVATIAQAGSRYSTFVPLEYPLLPSQSCATSITAERLFCFSAPSAPKLRLYLLAMANFAQVQSEICRPRHAHADALARAAFTIQFGRRHYPRSRITCVVSSWESLKDKCMLAVAKLDAQSPSPASGSAGKKRQLVFLFPGQGSQHLKMARQLYGCEPVFRKLVTEICLEANVVGAPDMLRLLFQPGTLSEAELKRTDNAQLALFIVSFALAKFWIRYDVRPAAMIGYSLGELVAATLAGVLNLQDALALTLERGRLMNSMEPGGMVQVMNCSEAELKDLLNEFEDLTLAVHNTKHTFVLGGPQQSTTRLLKHVRMLRKEKRTDLKAALLATSHAFHSPAMTRAGKGLEQWMHKRRSRQQQPKPLTSHESASGSPAAVQSDRCWPPYVSNVTATWQSLEQATNPSYYSNHIRSPVQFAKSLDFLVNELNADAVQLLEVGPGQTMTRLAARHFQQRGLPSPPPSLTSLPHAHRPNEPSDQFCWLSAVGHLWETGHSFNFELYWQDRQKYCDGTLVRMSVPTFGLEQRRCFVGNLFTGNEEHTKNGPLSRGLGDATFSDHADDDTVLEHSRVTAQSRGGQNETTEQPALSLLPTDPSLTSKAESDLVEHSSTLLQVNSDEVDRGFLDLYESFWKGGTVAKDPRLTFFERGATSLDEQFLLSQIKTKYGVSLDYDAFRNNSTPAACWALIRTRMRRGTKNASTPQQQQLQSHNEQPQAWQQVTVPLTSLQRTILFEQLRHPWSRAYNMGVLYAGESDLAPQAIIKQLTQAIRYTFQDNPLVCAHVSGHSLQTINPLSVAPSSIVADTPVIFSDSDPERAFLKFVGQEIKIDDAAVPPLRVAVLVMAHQPGPRSGRGGGASHTTAPAQVHIAVALHHLVADGYSFNIVLNRLFGGAMQPLRHLDTPGIAGLLTTHVHWESNLPNSLLAWWKKRLQHVPKVLKFMESTRRSRPAPDAEIERKEISLSAGAAAGMRAAARKLRVPLLSVLLAGSSIVLQRWTGQPEILVGVPHVNRRTSSAMGVACCVADVLPVTVQVLEDATIEDVIRSAAESVEEALAHAVPFAKLARALATSSSMPEGRNARSAPSMDGVPPMCQFQLHYSPPAEDQKLSTSTQLRPQTIVGGLHAQVPLLLRVYDRGGDTVPTMVLEWDSGFFSNAWGKRLGNQLERVLESTFDQQMQQERWSECPAQSVPVFNLKEYTEVKDETVNKWARKLNTCPSPASDSFGDSSRWVNLAEMVLGPSTQYSANVAIIDEDGQKLSYADVMAETQKTANWLRLLGVHRGTIVVVEAHKCLLTPIALLAIMHVGAAYLPLEGSHATQRLAQIIQEADPALVVVFPGSRSGRTNLEAATVAATTGCRAVELLSSSTTTAAIGENDAIVNTNTNDFDPQDRAYVLYTSGSTGEPKGVAVTHKNVCAFIDAMQETGARVKPGDTLSCVHALLFDFSVWEMFGALCNGAALLMVSPRTATSQSDLIRLLNKHNVTVFSQTPQAFSMFVKHEALFAKRVANGRSHAANLRLGVNAGADGYPLLLPGLRAVVFAGDKLDYARLNTWFTRYDDSQTHLFNCYGITETSVFSTCRLVTRLDADRASQSNFPYSSLIGSAMANNVFHVFNRYGRYLPPGTTGELYIGGLAVAQQYIKKPDLTRSRFLQLELAGGVRVFKTGDVVRYVPELDEYDFLGRSDNQLKVRGHRVEPFEVERAVQAHHGVKQAVVVMHSSGRLTAFVTRVETEAVALNEANVLEFVSQRLPKYMVPQQCIVLDSIPTTSNKKVDRKLLTGWKASETTTGTIAQIATRATSASDAQQLPQPQDAGCAAPTLPWTVVADIIGALQPGLPSANTNGRPIGGSGTFRRIQLPKFPYPSGGSLYSVQTYLVTSAFVEGMPKRHGPATTTWYYNPVQHRLVPTQEMAVVVAKLLQPPIACIGGYSAALLFVSAPDVIEHLYPGAGDYFSTIEAGCMVHAIEKYVGAMAVHGPEVVAKSAGHLLSTPEAQAAGINMDGIRKELRLTQLQQVLAVVYLSGR